MPQPDDDSVPRVMRMGTVSDIGCAHPMAPLLLSPC